MKTESFRDVLVIFRGRRAFVQARRVYGESRDVFKVQLSSLHFETGDADGRGQAIQQTYLAGDGDGIAFEGLDVQEQQDLKRQVREAFGA